MYKYRKNRHIYMRYGIGKYMGKGTNIMRTTMRRSMRALIRIYRNSSRAMTSTNDNLHFAV